MIFFLACILAAAPFWAVHCQGPFTVHIITRNQYKFGEDVECNVTITNTESQDHRILARDTPLDGLRDDIFYVNTTAADGTELSVPYDSIMVKRGPAYEDEFEGIIIRAMSSVVSTVDLSEAYSFANPGIYNVQLYTTFYYHLDGVTTQHVYSNIAHFIIELGSTDQPPKLTRGELARLDSDKQLIVADHKPKQNVTGCKTPIIKGKYPKSSKKDIEKSFSLAYDKIEDSIAALSIKNNVLYKTWFGSTYNPVVSKCYNKMYNAMGTYQYTLFANPTKKDNKDVCKDSEYAFTYTDCKTIYLCSKYFSAPLKNENSKTGVIVHEMSHAAAGTEDVKLNGKKVYGRKQCKELAKNNPQLAVKNGDNYQYFSEDVKKLVN